MKLNTLRPRLNGRHFADDILKCIFLNENTWIPIEMSLKFVPQGPINNIPALVQIMAWRRPGDKPLSGPMTVRLPTHICVTRPQWVKKPPIYLVDRFTFLCGTKCIDIHIVYDVFRPLCSHLFDVLSRIYHVTYVRAELERTTPRHTYRHTDTQTHTRTHQQTNIHTCRPLQLA